MQKLFKPYKEQIRLMSSVSPYYHHQHKNDYKTSAIDTLWS